MELDAAWHHLAAVAAPSIPLVAEAIGHLQQAARFFAPAAPLLLEQIEDLPAREVHHHQRIAERQDHARVAHRCAAVIGVEILAHAAVVHEGDLRAERPAGQQHRIGHQVAQRGFAAVGALAHHAGYRQARHGARQQFGAARARGIEVRLQLRIGRPFTGHHHLLARADGAQRVGAGIDGELDAAQHMAAHVRLRDGAAVHLAQVTLVRVAAHHQPHGRVEALDDVGHGTGQFAAIGLVEFFGGAAALVDQRHEHAHALLAQFRQLTVDGVRFVDEFEAGDARGQRRFGSTFQDRADERDLDAVGRLDLVGRQHRLAGGHVDHVGGQVRKPGAAEIGFVLAGLVHARRLAAAALLTQQLHAAAVEFVVAHRAGAQAQQVHGADGGFIRPHGGDGGTGAHQVARADEQQLGVVAAPGLQRGADGVDAARVHGARTAALRAVPHVLARFQVAVKIVERDQLDVDQPGGRRVRFGGLGQRRGTGSEQGGQRNRSQGTEGRFHCGPDVSESIIVPRHTSAGTAERPLEYYVTKRFEHKKTAGVATGRSVFQRRVTNLEFVLHRGLNSPLRFAFDLAHVQGFHSVAHAVDVAVLCIDTDVVDERTRLRTATGVEAHFVDTAPLLVQQIADVEDIQRERRLVLVEEAGHFLRQADVEAVGPWREIGVTTDHAASSVFQYLVAVDDCPELVFVGMVGGGIASKHDLTRTWRRRDVHQIVTGNAVAVQVIVDGPAVRLAGTAFVEQAEGGVIGAEQALAEVDQRIDTVFYQVARVGADFFVRVEYRTAAVVRARGGRRQGRHFTRLGVGVRQRPLHAVDHRTAQGHGGQVAAALVGRGGYQHVVVRGVAAGLVTRWRGAGGAAGGAGVDQGASRGPASCVVATRGVIQFAAVGTDLGWGAQVQVLVVDTILVLDLQEFHAQHQVVPRQFGIEGNVRFPDRWLLQAWRQRVHVDLRHSAVWNGRALLGDVSAEQTAGRRARTGRRTAADGRGGHARIRERVRQPYRGGSALEQADTTAQLHLARRVERVVEACARLPDVLTVEGVGVVDAEAAGLAVGGGSGGSNRRLRHGGVTQRTVVDAGRVQARAVAQGQLVVDGPGILHEHAVVLHAEVRHGVVQRKAVVGGLQRVRRWTAEAEVFQHGGLHVGIAQVAAVGHRRRGAQRGVSPVRRAREGVVAPDVLQEGVVDLVLGVIAAELDFVVAQRPVGAHVTVQGLGAQDVALTAVIGTEAQRTRGGRHRRWRAGRVGAGERQADQRQLRVQGRHAVVVAVRYLDFGREGRGPVGGPLGHHGLDLLALRIPFGVERQAGGGRAGELRFRLLGFRVAEHGAVVVVDVPVNLGQVVVHVQRGARAQRRVARIETVHVLGDVGGGSNRGRADADVGLGAAQRAEGRRGAGRFQLFVGGKQEQLVLDQRQADSGAFRGFLERGWCEIGVGRIVVTIAGQLVITEHVIDIAFDGVGAGLGDGIDVTAGIALLGNVVVGHVDLHRLDRFDRNRLLGGRAAVRFQAERIVDGHAVDGQRVVARVLAGHGNFAAVLVGLGHARVGAGVVLQVTVDRTLDRQFGRADAGARTHGGARELVRTAGSAGNGHGLHLGAEGRVHGGGFRQLDEHVVAFFRDAILGDRDRVRTACAQAALDVTAFGVGDDVGRRARLGVNDGHGRTGGRLAVARRNAATNRRRRVLSHGRDRRERDRQAERDLRQLEPFMIDHCVTPIKTNNYVEPCWWQGSPSYVCCNCLKATPCKKGVPELPHSGRDDDGRTPSRGTLFVAIGQERVTNTVVRQLFNFRVRRLVTGCKQRVLAGQVVARHPGVVGGQHERHAILAEQGDRVRLVLDAEDEIVAAQVDLDRNILIVHLFHDAQRIAFVGNVHAMADAARARHVQRLLDVELQPFRLHHAQRQLARVQRQFDGRIFGFQELVHLHVQRVVAHRHVRAFLAHDVDAHDQRTGGGQLEARHHLRKHLRRRQEAQRERLVAQREAGVVDAGARRLDVVEVGGDPALERLVAVELADVGGQVGVGQAARQGLVIETGVLGNRGDLENGFDIAQVFLDGAALQGLQAVGRVGGRNRVEVGERVEKLAVGRGLDGAVVIEILVGPALQQVGQEGVILQAVLARQAHALGQRLGALGLGGGLVHVDAVAGLVDAIAFLVHPAQVLLGIDGARIMVVQVATLGHQGEEHGQLGQLGFLARHQGGQHVAGDRFRQRKQQLFQAVGVGGAALQQRRALRVDHDEIGLGARRKIADRAFELHAARRAQRGQVKHPQGRQVAALQARYFIGFIHGLQHRERRAAAHVGGQRQQHARLVGAFEVEQAAAQEQVGRGADGRRRPRFRHAPAVLLVEPDAVAVHGARTQHAVAVVHVDIAARLREQLAHPGAFGFVFRHVGLDIRVGIGARQFGGQVQLLVGGRGRKARRDRVLRPAAVVPALDQRFGVARAAFGRVAQEVRAIAVHQHLAGHHAQAARFAGREERVHRCRVHGAVHHGRGGAAAQQLVEEEFGHVPSVRRVLEAAFHRKGIGLQPWQQPFRGRRDHVRLRIVDMGVDKAGHEQLAAVVVHRSPRRQRGVQRGIVARRPHLAAGDDQQAVFMPGMGAVAEGRIGEEVQQAASVGLQVGGGHRSFRELKLKWLYVGDAVGLRLPHHQQLRAHGGGNRGGELAGNAGEPDRAHHGGNAVWRHPARGQATLELYPFCAGADQAEPAHAGARQDRLGQALVERVAVGEHQVAGAGRGAGHQRFGRIGRFHRHVGGHGGGKLVFALVDPGDGARQFAKQADDGRAHVAGAEQQQMGARRRAGVDQPAAAGSVAHDAGAGPAGKVGHGGKVGDGGKVAHGGKVGHGRAMFAGAGAGNHLAMGIVQQCCRGAVDGGHAPAVVARAGAQRGQHVVQRGVDHLERQVHHAAAALAQRGAQRVALDARGAGAGIVQHGARQVHGAQFQVAAADSVDLAAARDQHLGAGLARAGALHDGHRHQHRRFIDGDQPVAHDQTPSSTIDTARRISSLQQRRLAHGFRAVDAVLDVAVVVQGHAQVVRAVGNTGDLVSGRRVRHQFAGAVPPQLLGREPAHALDERALHLADVDGGVERTARVVQRIGAQQLPFAGERVHHHLGDGRAIGVVRERMAAHGFRVPVQAGRGIKAVGPQLHPGQVRLLHQRREWHHVAVDVHRIVHEAHRLAVVVAVLLDRVRGEPLADLARRILRGLAIEVGAGGRGRGRRIGDLAGVGGRHPQMVDGDAQFVGDYLHHLGVDALPHLGAAVVDQYRAVDIHVHQRARLVQVRDVEGDTEFERRERQPFFQHRAGVVERVDGGAARAVGAGRFEFGRQGLDHVVDDFLAVGRDVAVGAAIEIEAADIERVAPQVAGDVVDDVFDGDGALRAAEAPERRVGLGVGLAAAGQDFHVRQIIRVVEVADGACGNRAGQVGRVAGAQRHVHLGGQDLAGVVVTHLVLVEEAVALAGDQHVVVAVGAQLDRAFQPGRRNAGRRRPKRRLRFLAAEAPAHAPALDLHLVRMHAQRMRDHVLHLARMLGGALHQHAVVLFRDRVGDLPFQVKLLLAAHEQLAPGHARRHVERGLEVAALQAHGRHHVRLRRFRFLRRQDRGQFLVVDLGAARGAAGVVMGVRHHDEHRLAHVQHFAGAENRIVVDDRTAVVGAHDVLRRVHGHHAGSGAHGRQIDGRDARMRPGGQSQSGVQRALQLGDVVGVGGLAQHRRLDPGFEPEAAQQVLRRLHPIAAGRAHVGQRREVLRNHVHRHPQVGFVPAQARERTFRARRAPWRGGHAAVGDAGVHDMVAVERERERRAHGRNILVEALGQFIGAELDVLARQRHPHGSHDFICLQIFFLVVEVERFQRQRARARWPLQHHLAADSDQPRHRVADGRTVGHVAAQRAGVTDRQRRETLAQFAQLRRIQLAQRVVGVFQRDAGADVQHAALLGHRLQRGHVAQVDDVAQFAQLLGDPQADVGGAGQQRGVRMGGAQRHQFVHRARRIKGAAAGRVADARLALQGAQLGRDGGAVERHARQFRHAVGSVDDGAVAGAATQVAGQAVVDFAALCGLAVFIEVHAPQRHHESRRAEAALRAMTVHHGLLHRVQRAAVLLQVFDRKQRLAIERGRELDAGIDRLHVQLAGRIEAADDHGAGAAIALGAAFLGAGGVQVFAQVLEHGSSGVIRVHGAPVVGDIDAAGDPHLVVALHVIEEARQRGQARRPAHDAAVQADGQHLGRVQPGRVALGVQHVEGVLQIVEELRARVETLGGGKAHVVGVERVGHDQLRCAGHLAVGAGVRDLLPERQVVAVVIGVVGEAAVFHDQPARIGRVAPRVPALRRAARQVADDVHGFLHVGALGGFVHVLVADPAQAVAGDFVAQRLERGHRLGMALERHRHAKHGERQLAVFEQAQHAPQARARAVFVQRLHAHVAVGKRRRADDLGQKGLGTGVAVQYTVLGALLVVEHELQRHARLARPPGVGRRGTVADQVARIVVVGAHASTHERRPVYGEYIPNHIWDGARRYMIYTIAACHTPI
uniref:Uncharacterized protein n=1 Tax=Tanacetum cinerariifolium TaxID=118510 RepID=A0A699GE39_TANCI|nr:hypothetical protein [Tanacetum cinerariifolium]